MRRRRMDRGKLTIWAIILGLPALGLLLEFVPVLNRGIERILLAAFGLLATGLAVGGGVLIVAAFTKHPDDLGHSRGEAAAIGIAALLLGGWISYISFFR